MLCGCRCRCCTLLLEAPAGGADDRAAGAAGARGGGRGAAELSSRGAAELRRSCLAASCPACTRLAIAGGTQPRAGGAQPAGLGPPAPRAAGAALLAGSTHLLAKFFTSSGRPPASQPHTSHIVLPRCCPNHMAAQWVCMAPMPPLQLQPSRRGGPALLAAAPPPSCCRVCCGSKGSKQTLQQWGAASLLAHLCRSGTWIRTDTSSLLAPAGCSSGEARLSLRAGGGAGCRGAGSPAALRAPGQGTEGNLRSRAGCAMERRSGAAAWRGSRRNDARSQPWKHYPGCHSNLQVAWPLGARKRLPAVATLDDHNCRHQTRFALAAAQASSLAARTGRQGTLTQPCVGMFTGRAPTQFTVAAHPSPDESCTCAYHLRGQVMPPPTSRLATSC
jgi:hypothetical protein